MVSVEGICFYCYRKKFMYFKPVIDMSIIPINLLSKADGKVHSVHDLKLNKFLFLYTFL